jgi:hypothetical protein
MQQGLKLQQSGNSAKLLLAEAVHRRTMRCNELIKVKRLNAQLKVKSSRRSLNFSQKQFSEWRHSFRDLKRTQLIKRFKVKVFARNKSTARFCSRINQSEQISRSSVDR